MQHVMPIANVFPGLRRGDEKIYFTFPGQQ
jgi:hypothetical protein